MSRRPVALLVCLVAIEAARYGDYSGARMPHYSIEYENKDPASLTDEYSDRSPDVAPPFDYKYEEEQRGKIYTPDQADTWQKRSQNRKRPLKATDERIEIGESEHNSPEFKSSHRYQKHRTRIKDVHKESDRRHYQYDRNHYDDVYDIDDKNENKINRHRSRNDNRIDLDNIEFRDTTRKVAKRKPRDRTTSHERLDNDNIRNDKLDFKGKERDEDVLENEYEKERNLQTTIEKSRVHFPGVNKVNQKNYQEYDEYYDMKRVNSMKNKLPGLFRQTKASTSMSESPSMRRFQDITYRRANPPDEHIQLITDASSTEITTSTSSVVLITQTTIMKEEPTPMASTDLSLAEKSRLSILKKAQRKEGLNNATWTTKPPVLMQVTKQMQTLVMVEPNKQDANFRARAVFDDSPDRIARAKYLMRRKLLAGTRNVQELIDKWDEMVCDYIDVSLLDNGDGRRVPSDVVIILLSVIKRLITNLFI